MSKSIYIGDENNKARKIKSIYIGVPTEIPEYYVSTISITGDNISDYFSISNGTYGFLWNDTNQAFQSSNSGVGSSTGTSTWTALQDLTNVSFTYSYATEASYDKFYLTVNGTSVVSAVSGTATVKTWSGDIAKGNTIVLKYTKDSSVNNNGDVCKLYNFTSNIKNYNDNAGEIKEIAKRVVKAYIGDENGIAKCFYDDVYEEFEVISEEDIVSNFTAITISNKLSDGNSYKYAVNVDIPSKYEDLSSWNNLTLDSYDETEEIGYATIGASAYGLSEGDKLIVVEVDSNNKAIKYGSATIDLA